ncbi:MAG: Fic family protein [Firmicutes bacterium]|nr:Fic family protein [Bacillota bacterium]
MKRRRGSLSAAIRSLTSIGGSSYIPPLPIESQVKENLAEILDIDDPIDRAISALLYVMKAQIFLDGNKRTAVLFANHILISHGEGLIVIPADKVAEYKELLVNYYEDKPQGEEQIRDFLISQALLRL